MHMIGGSFLGRCHIRSSGCVGCVGHELREPAICCSQNDSECHLGRELQLFTLLTHPLLILNRSKLCASQLLLFVRLRSCHVVETRFHQLSRTRLGHRPHGPSRSLWTSRPPRPLVPSPWGLRLGAAKRHGPFRRRCGPVVDMGNKAAMSRESSDSLIVTMIHSDSEWSEDRGQFSVFFSTTLVNSPRP